jgi:hypothetical protein
MATKSGLTLASGCSLDQEFLDEKGANQPLCLSRGPSTAEVFGASGFEWVNGGHRVGSRA